MKYSVDELLKSGLLRKIPKSKQRAEESMRTASAWLKEAENDFQSGSLRSCILVSYLAMFHAARAILFADGFREKSHFAVEDTWRIDIPIREYWKKNGSNYLTITGR